MNRISKCGFIFACVAALLLSFGCGHEADPEVETEEGGLKKINPGNVGKGGAFSVANPVQKVSLNNEGSGSVTLSGLSGNDVFLVKVNTSGSSKNASIAQSGFADGEQVMDVPAGVITIDGKTLTRYERHWQVPPPAAVTTLARRSLASVYTEAQTVGATKDFFVDVSPTSETFTQRNATLKVIGTHCKVWVVNDYFTSSANGTDGKVNLTQLKELANKFDVIYPLETALLGYENGGGTGGDGGADGDSKIQILVYDIDGDVNDSSRTGITLGYFYQVDEYPRSGDTNSPYSKSNEAEIFYLDSEMLDREPDIIYSTLIHEFNHMINYNIKAIQKPTFSVTTWYTEMLSMLAEDVIGPLVGIPYEPKTDNGNVIIARIHLSRWLDTYYKLRVMYWDNTLDSYAANYAFGAYLVRNFGGPELLHEIAISSLDGKASLDDALQKLNPQINGQNVDTGYALSRFGEALVYSGDNMPAGVFSFDKTVSKTIGGNAYTFPRFNIWDMAYTDQKNYYKGPIILVYDQAAYSIPSNAVQLFSRESWLNVSGQLTIQVQNGNSGVDYYVMVK